MAACEMSYPAYWPPRKFVIETQTELKSEVLLGRCRHLNVVLRLAMLTGLQMQLDSTINLLCDMASEIVSFDRAMIWFSGDAGEEARRRLVRGQAMPEDGDAAPDINVLQVWAAQYARPLIVGREQNPEADVALLPFRSALVVPLFVDSQVAGSMQLFSMNDGHFTEEDAQLLWVFSLVAENLLSRGTAHEGLLRFAFTDYLTGLRSRRFFEQQLDQELKRAQRHQQQFALLRNDLAAFADSALYAAKREGRNRVVCYSELVAAELK